MNPIEQFRRECDDRIDAQGRDPEVQAAARAFRYQTVKSLYTYHFTWLSRPIIQYPQDIVAVQELVWSVRPDLIIETGIAHGGSLVLSASLLALLDYCDAVESGSVLDPKSPRRRVLGVDIDIRAHNRAAIEQHPLAGRIDLIQGSATAPAVVEQVRAVAARFQRVLVFLDSNHTHEHVLAELLAYAPLVSVGSYCVVFDTIIEDMPDDTYPDRPWGPGNNPKSAVQEFLRRTAQGEVVTHAGTKAEFAVDKRIDHQLLVSMAPDGYLRRTA